MKENEGKKYQPTCCKCKIQLDGHKSIIGKETPPKPGDFAVCASCGFLNIIDDDMKFRPANLDDIIEIPLKHLTDLILTARKVRMDNKIEAQKKKAEEPKNPSDKWDEGY